MGAARQARRRAGRRSAARERSADPGTLTPASHAPHDHRRTSMLDTMPLNRGSHAPPSPSPLSGSLMRPLLHGLASVRAASLIASRRLHVRAQVVTAPTPAATGRAGNGKRKAVASAAGASTSAAGSSTATGLPRVTPGHNAPSARPGPSRTSHAPKRTLVERDAVEAAPAIDIGALSAAQLAELQVRIAQQLQVVSS